MKKTQRRNWINVKQSSSCPAVIFQHSSCFQVLGKFHLSMDLHLLCICVSQGRVSWSPREGGGKYVLCVCVSVSLVYVTRSLLHLDSALYFYILYGRFRPERNKSFNAKVFLAGQSYLVMQD